MKMIQTMLKSWQGLQQRERHIITAGGALLVLAALWLLSDNLLTERNRLLEEKNRLAENLVWMREQSELLAQIQHSCAGSRILDDDPEQLFQRLAQRNQLSLDELQRSRDGVLHLRFSSSDGNRVLALVHQSVCQGYMLESISITQRDETGAEGSAVVAQLELSGGRSRG